MTTWAEPAGRITYQVRRAATGGRDKWLETWRSSVYYVRRSNTSRRWHPAPRVEEFDDDGHLK